MEVYYITILFLALFSFFEFSLKEDYLSKKIIKTLKIIAFIILVAQMGFRWETGTDWQPYLDHFNTFSNKVRWYGYEDQMEIGYEFLTYSLYNLFNNYSFFLLINAIIYYLLLFKSIQFFSHYRFLSLLLFYSFSLGLLGSNRQLISMNIGLISLIYLYRKKYKHYLFFVGIAFLFHTTSVLFLIYYFLNKKINKKYLLLILLFCIALGYTSVPFFIFSYFGGISDIASQKAMIYLDGAKEVSDTISLSVFGLLKRILLLILFTLNYKRINAVFPRYNLLYNGFVVGLAFYFLFSNSLLVMISRGSLYFNAMEPILISLQLIIIKDKLKFNLMYLLIILYAIFNLNQGIESYRTLFEPYKGIFYNEEYRRTIF